MRKLIAKVPILHHSSLYGAGSSLPYDDKMSELWVEAGSAMWVEDDEEEKKHVKATPVSAEAGVSGTSSDGDSEALAGKPKRRKRVM